MSNYGYEQSGPPVPEPQPPHHRGRKFVVGVAVASVALYIASQTAVFGEAASFGVGVLNDKLNGQPQPDMSVDQPIVSTDEPVQQPSPSAKPVATGVAGNPKASPSDKPKSLAECLPVDTLVNQILMVGGYADKSENVEKMAALVSANQIGGVNWLVGPSGSGDNGLQSFSDNQSIPVLMAAQEEGGSVQPFAAALGALPAPAAVAPGSALPLMSDHAQKLANFGIDVVFTPANVAPADGSASPLGDRVYSADPTAVSDIVKENITALTNNGILPVLSSFPGEGALIPDPAGGLATTPPFDALAGRDVKPFEVVPVKSEVGLQLSSAIVPGLTLEGVPATLSGHAVKAARISYGYGNGIVFSGDISKLPGSISDNVVGALKAGADFIRVDQPAEGTTWNIQIKAINEAIRQAIATNDLSTERIVSANQKRAALLGYDPCAIKGD